jgi:anaerobic magnesium-protoporphyrin IX monomethyl ester cyclase
MILINTVAPNRMGMISHYMAVSVPIGVGMLAGYLLSKGKRVKIIDEQICPYEEVLQDIKAYLREMPKPYIFGISSLTINIYRSLEIAAKLKSDYPDSRVIMGGIHPTVLPDEVLSHPAVDIVVRGEGEKIVFSLYEAIENGRGLSDIAGISFKDGGRVIHNPDAPLVECLDEISLFPYQLFDPKKYNLNFITSSRGCPFNCIFCSQRSISGRKYRFRTAESIIKEIELLVDTYHQRLISFLDDDFLVNKERVRGLCDLIVRHRLHERARFVCQARADNVDEEILSYLKKANFSDIGLGIETASERLMSVINKGETVKDNIMAAKLIKKMGFALSALFMFGLPSETKKERFQTYLLAKSLKTRFVKFNNIVPYPGTKLFEIAQKEGQLNIEENWKNFNSVGGVVGGVFSDFKLPYVPAGTRERELKRDLIRANLYFYLTQPSIILALLRRKNTDWFAIPGKWYFDLREYYYLLRLAARVFVNAIVVFDLWWFVQDIYQGIRNRQGGSSAE